MLILTVSSDKFPFYSSKTSANISMIVYVAGMWNLYRSASLCCLKFLFRCGQYLQTENQPFEGSSEFRFLKRATTQLADDICASFACHIYKNNQMDLASFVAAAGGEQAPSRTFSTIQGMFLMWPLYVASVMTHIPESQRSWIKGRLRWLDRQLGLRLAGFLADRPTGEYPHHLLLPGAVLLWSGSIVQLDEEVSTYEKAQPSSSAQP